MNRVRSSLLMLLLGSMAVACGSDRASTRHGAAAAVAQTSLPSKAAPGESSPDMPSSRAQATPADSGISIEAVARTSALEDVFLVTGELSAVRSLDLVTPRSEMWQVQIKWLAEDGENVQEGQRVIEFDNRAVAQSIEEKKLAHIQSGIDLESRRASLSAEGEDKRFALERAETEAEKARTQAAIPRDILSLRDWQEKQAALRRAEAALEKARLDLNAFQVASKAERENLEIARDKAARAIESAQRTIEALSIKAPKSGIFVVAENWQEDRKFQLGDTTWPGRTVATIPDLATMEVVGYLSDVDDDRIRPEMAARCILDTYPDRVYPGKVEEVAGVADRKGFRTRISLETSDPTLMRPGMSVRIEVVRRSWEHALVIPKHALRMRDEKTFVLRAGETDPVEVRVAGCTPIDCVIESGLSEGDRVTLR